VTGPPERRDLTPPVAPEARDRVVEVLTRHFADDRITAEDLEARLERVYHATTGAELAAIVADLQAAVPAGRAAGTLAPDDAPRRIAALFSGHEERLTGVVPRALQLRGRLGYVELDLTRATFEPGLTEIDVRAFMGYVQVRLPAGIRVESRGRAIFGFFSLHRPEAAGPEDASVTVRISGRAMFGFAECFVSAKHRAVLPRAGDAAPDGGAPRLPPREG
jgi:DUF1707 SHOCT-like domain